MEQMLDFVVNASLSVPASQSIMVPCNEASTDKAAAETRTIFGCVGAASRYLRSKVVGAQADTLTWVWPLYQKGRKTSQGFDSGFDYTDSLGITLQRVPNLKFLHLNDNDLYVSSKLLDGLRCLTKLQSLDLCGNSFHLADLQPALVRMPQLRSLNLGSNSQIAIGRALDVELDAVFRALRSLECLHMNDCGIDASFLLSQALPCNYNIYPHTC